MNQVQQLISEIREWASKNGLTLHRYVTNSRRGMHYQIISYTLHPANQERPHRADKCQTILAVLTAREGTTSRCEAYRQLANGFAVVN